MLDGVKRGFGKFVSKFTNGNVMLVGLIMALPAGVGVNNMLSNDFDDIARDTDSVVIEQIESQIESLSDLKEKQTNLDKLSNSNMTLDESAMTSFLERQGKLTSAFETQMTDLRYQVYSSTEISEAAYTEIAETFNGAGFDNFGLSKHANSLQESQIENKDISDKDKYIDEMASSMSVEEAKSVIPAIIVGAGLPFALFSMCYGLYGSGRVKRWAETPKKKKTLGN